MREETKYDKKENNKEKCYIYYMILTNLINKNYVLPQIRKYDMISIYKIKYR